VTCIFVSDCEGPISKNDNALELSENFVPNGDKLFANVSKYDDVLADVLHKQGYSSGSTLKLILPFFKAYSVTDRQMEDFSANNITLISKSQITLQHVQKISNAFIISTSYEHYIRALCNAVSFPFKNTYCTKVSLDKIGISPREKESLREIAQEIAKMQTIDIPLKAKGLNDFSDIDQSLIKRMDEIFCIDIPQMFVGKFLSGVVTVGGEQKAIAIRDAAKRLDAGLIDVMYVGDSITDVEAFKLVREHGGLSISFNGNGYAIRSAEVAILSESNLIIAAIADLFCKHGKKQTLTALHSWSLETLEKNLVDEILLKQLEKMYPECLPKAQIVTAKNMDSLTNESCDFRKKVRGITIGRLG
jgi:energy-converting hydrogenase A subunit R